MFHQLRAAIIAILRVALAVSFADALVFLLDVEGLKQLAGGENAKGLFVEGIEAAHHAAAVDVATKLVEVCEEIPAICEAVERDAVENHVVLATAFVRLEG